MAQSPVPKQRDPSPYAPRPAGAYARTPAAVTDVTPVSSTRSAPKETPAREENRLTVGPRIKLKGLEITDCDTLIVEGAVEATLDSRVMQIAEGGSFKGEAEIDLVEVRGEFEGKLTARQKLVIYATGRVAGQVRYGKLVVEEGGRLSGQLSVERD